MGHSNGNVQNRKKKNLFYKSMQKILKIAWMLSFILIYISRQVFYFIFHYFLFFLNSAMTLEATGKGIYIWKKNK